MPNPLQYIDISPEVIVQTVNDEMVILDMQSEEFFSLDDVGTDIWKYAADTKNLDATVSAIVSDYDVSEEQARRDVTILLEQLAEAGLVRLHDTPPVST